MAVQQVLYPRLVAAELLLYRPAYADYGTVVDILLLQDVVAPEQTCLQRPHQLLCVHPVCLHHLLILCRRNVSGMDYHALDANLLQGVVGGVTAETRLIDSLVLAFRVILPQKVKEHFCRSLLGMTPNNSYFGGY